MRYCKECDVNIITPISKCPLCKSATISVSGSEIYAYPDLHTKNTLDSIYSGLMGAMKTTQLTPV